MFRRINFVQTTVAVAFLVMPIHMAEAQNVWHTAHVRQIYPLSNGSWVVMFVTDSNSCLNANPNKYYYVTPGVNGVTLDGAANMLSVALTAAATDREITVIFDDAAANCYVNRLSVRFDDD